MFDPFTGWNRMMAVGAAMTRTGMRIGETMSAATQVVAARTPMIETAMHSPLTGELTELGRMVPEKVEAFSRAGLVAVAAWWSAQSAWIPHLQHVSGIVARGRPPTPGELFDLGSRSAEITLGSIEAWAKVGADTLNPIHKTVTANARRLVRKPVVSRRSGAARQP